MKDIISYAKEAQEAFKNYINGENVDLSLCHKIYDDISHIESLDEESKRDLDSFINNNALVEIPLSVGLDSDKYGRFFRRMLPIKLSRGNRGVQSAKGDFSSIVADSPASITVKVKRRTYARKGA